MSVFVSILVVHHNCFSYLNSGLLGDFCHAFAMDILRMIEIGYQSESLMVGRTNFPFGVMYTIGQTQLQPACVIDFPYVFLYCVLKTLRHTYSDFVRRSLLVFLQCLRYACFSASGMHVFRHMSILGTVTEDDIFIPNTVCLGLYHN